MFKTADGSLTWNALSSFLTSKQSPRTPGLTVVDPTNPNLVFAGAINLERSTDGGATWVYIYTGAWMWRLPALFGDGDGSVINPVNPNIVYADTNAGGIYKSTAGGATGSFAALPNTPIVVGKIVMDFATPTTLYEFAGAGLFQTMDGGSTWPAFGPAGKGIVEDVAVAPSDSNTVVAVESGAIPWVTKNAQSGAAVAWTGGLPTKAVASTTSTQRIVIDPADPNKLYSLQGNGLLGAPLVVSGDEGMGWRAVDFGPNVVGIPRDLVVDPDCMSPRNPPSTGARTEALPGTLWHLDFR